MSTNDAAAPVAIGDPDRGRRKVSTRHLISTPSYNVYPPQVYALAYLR